MMPQSMKPTPIDLEYYQWLISQVQVGPRKQYFGLFEILHNTEFTWFVPNDDNRVADGEHLRNDFFRTTRDRKYEDGDLALEGVSVLEVIVALSKRVAFNAGGDADLWAWRLIKNLGLNKMADPLTPRKIQNINDILDILIWRNYEPSGAGGFFPLKRSLKDQTKVEIWYQMQEYVMEQEGMD